MIRHFHGSPIWGAKGEVAKIAHRDGGAFISYARTDQITLVYQIADQIGLDNGAFSAWKRGAILDWNLFYRWLDKYYENEKTLFFVIPDIIEGSEIDNDRLIRSVPEAFRDKAAPTWHLHESIDRLINLCADWPRVCFGSSGEYAVVRSPAWHRRMKEAFTAIYKSPHRPMIHGLRMLDNRVLGQWPLTTADSTNLASNVPKLEVKYPEITAQLRGIGCNDDEVKMGRCAILRAAIEKSNPPTYDQWASMSGLYPCEFWSKN
ncbi:putative queuine tRNA-ribosyltransferase [Pantoea phage vB_PagS_MED16]|nr:putative queuine tRNA-ribosyltransferase [Pantoea phage vB_PagS_MED16]